MTILMKSLRRSMRARFHLAFTLRTKDQALSFGQQENFRLEGASGICMLVAASGKALASSNLSQQGAKKVAS